MLIKPNNTQIYVLNIAVPNDAPELICDILQGFRDLRDIYKKLEIAIDV